MRIVVTGVSRGLGAALVHGFAEAGHTVFGCARSEDRVQQLQQQYASRGHEFRVVDLRDAHAVDRWAMDLVDRAGAPQLIVNNAALINTNAPLWEVSVDEFSAVMDVNLKGMFHVIRAFLPAMIKAGEGIIVNMSSGWGRSAASQVAPYCASKWGVEGLTQSLAKELPTGLAAIPLNPGIIHTEMLDSCFGASARGFPTADDWATRAVPYILGLSAEENGRPLSVPGR